MWKFNTILVFCLIGLCVAANPSNTKANNKQKDNKEKRDAAVTAGPYTYESPQKSFQIPIHGQSQQKPAHIEYQTSQKVAPIEYHHQQQQQQQHQQPKQQYQSVHIPTQTVHESAPQYPSSFGYPSIESFYRQPVKSYSNSAYNFPEFESYEHIPSFAQYNGQYGSNKINSEVVAIPNFAYKTPSYPDIKPEYSFSSQSHGLPAPAYSFNSHSYAVPQQQVSYVSSYAPSEQSQYSGYSQSPASYFIPQTISIASKPAKVPDYALGLKGLSHFSTISSPAQSSYVKPSYEAPQIVYSQTERPFKASSFLGSSSHQNHDSHTEQSISSFKPAGEYLPPSKTYLPAKEQYTPEPAQEYQVQYISQPSKNYLPPTTNYLPPTTNYLPPKAPKNNYLPPTNSYIPPSNNQNQYSHQQQQQQQQQQPHYQQYQTESYDYQQSQTGHAGHK